VLFADHPNTNQWFLDERVDLLATVEREGHLFGWISRWVEEHLVYKG